MALSLLAAPVPCHFARSLLTIRWNRFLFLQRIPPKTSNLLQWILSTCRSSYEQKWNEMRMTSSEFQFFPFLCCQMYCIDCITYFKHNNCNQIYTGATQNVTCSIYVHGFFGAFECKKWISLFEIRLWRRSTCAHGECQETSCDGTYWNVYFERYNHCCENSQSVGHCIQFNSIQFNWIQFDSIRFNSAAFTSMQT